MKAANGVTNMVLAHEIAVNKDFKLEKIEAPQDRYKQVVELHNKVLHICNLL